MPPLADAYYQRPETGLALRGGLYPGDTIVLTHDEEAGPAAHGGTGKTQLAVAYAHALWSVRAVEVLVWVTATDRAAIVAGFASAAATVGAEAAASRAAASRAEAAASQFVAWLAHTRRPWALIIDDLNDLDDLAGLWPAGEAGQVVITTRRPGLRPAVPGLRIAPVGAFNRREALSYLSARLTDYPDQRTEALELGEDLEGLPLALAQAAGVIKTTGLSCREYRAQFIARRAHMSGVQVDGVGATVLATWSLAAECAHDLAPAGLAWPGLALAATLDPNGVPGAVLTSPAACGYIAGRPSTAGETDQVMVRAAISNLARVGLVSIDPASAARTVRMHTSIQAAVRAYLPPADLGPALLAAADALIQAWPDGGEALTEQAFRDCASAAGRFDDAIIVFAAGLADRERSQGFEHPDTIRARGHLAHAYASAGRPAEAIALYEQMIVSATRQLGPGHPVTLAARDNLAAAYQNRGKHR